jgi:hypothetical protein
LIEKPFILITSLGRTGTLFFTELFAHILQDCTSLHEPDIFGFKDPGSKIVRFGRQVRTAGIWRMLILKALGKWTLVKLSDARLAGRLDRRRAAVELDRQRRDFVKSLPGSVYVESNLGYYGLLDVLPEVYKDHRAVYIVRDGREWVRSHMSWGEAYGKKGIRRLLGHRWPAASELAGDKFAERWGDFSRFEKLCWAWSRLNGFALDLLEKNPQGMVFRFESLFKDEQRQRYLDRLVHFATDLKGIDRDSVGSARGWVDRRIHAGSNRFPDWQHWTADQQNGFREICGPLMDSLGYRF